MLYNKIFKTILIVMSLSTIPIYAESVDNPCIGPSSLISIINRPSIADSACAVPKKHAVLELGAQYQNLLYGGYVRGGNAKVFPEAELRVGLPLQNEFSILMPNYYRFSVPPHSGFTATGVKFKHQFQYANNLLPAIEGVLVLPTGSASFGSPSTGGVINGIVAYSFTDQLSITAMFGVGSIAYAANSGGQYFTSFNPDVIFSWMPRSNLDFFLEFFGQTKTGPGQGSGFNTDAGIIYLVSQHLTVDFEVGQRISGLLGGYNHYVGIGGAIEF